MKVMLTAIAEVYGLFVEDGSYAAGILLWVLAAGFALTHLPALGLWRAPLLFVGLVALLAENIARTSRK